jgi:hypothetical protein
MSRTVIPRHYTHSRPLRLPWKHPCLNGVYRNFPLPHLTCRIQPTISAGSRSIAMHLRGRSIMRRHMTHSGEVDDEAVFLADYGSYPTVVHLASDVLKRREVEDRWSLYGDSRFWCQHPTNPWMAPPLHLPATDCGPAISAAAHKAKVVAAPGSVDDSLVQTADSLRSLETFLLCVRAMPRDGANVSR